MLNNDRPATMCWWLTSTHLALQEYNVSKRVEHRFKALVHDSSTISAVSPVTYSRRFQSFLLNIFRPKPVKAAAAVLKLAMAAQNGEQDAAGSQQGAEHDSQHDRQQASQQPGAAGQQA